MALEKDRSLDELITDTGQTFRRQFGRPARWFFVAPGRVNLIGEHVDYNDGFVLPMAIERYTVVAASPSPPGSRAGQLNLYSASLNSLKSVAIGERREPPDWSSYVAGTLAECRAAGLDVGALEVAIDSTVPIGGGLSSSASLEVATASLAEAVTGMKLAGAEKAKLCQRAEHVYAGVPCGIMDQFAVACAREHHVILLDCRSLNATYVALPQPAPSILIVDSRVKHELGTSEYAVRRSQCEAACRTLGVTALRDLSSEELAERWHELDPVVARRARHVVSEIERTGTAADALAAGNWQLVGELMYASHRSLRDDYEVSCGELDLLVDTARQLGLAQGVFGARITGGGFGGCAVMLVEPTATEIVRDRLADAYRSVTGIEARSFVTNPAGVPILNAADLEA